MVQPINYKTNYCVNYPICESGSSNNISSPAIVKNEPTNFGGNIQYPPQYIFTSDIIKLKEMLEKKQLFFHPLFAPKKSAQDTILKKFDPSTRKRERDKKIENELEHIAQPIRKRTEYNTKQLKAAGVKEADIKKYLTIDGHVTDAGKKILREKGKSYK